MHRLGLGFAAVCLLCGLGFAQEMEDIRNPTINSETAEGQLITQAGMSEDPAEKIKYLETFVQKYGAHPAIGYVYLQLQNIYAQQENHDKVLEYGKKLLEMVPKDIEVRHNLTKAMEAKQQWDALLPHLVETKPLAEEVVASPKPADAYEDEEAIWKGQVEYAQGVVQYIEYSLYTSALKQTDPQAKIQYLNALREHYPDGQYAKLVPELVVTAYQQTGDFEKMLEAMEEAIAVNPQNEGFLYTLAENHFGKGEYDQAKGYAEQLLQVMEQKQKPEGQGEEEWMKHKELFTAYGNFVLGKILVAQAGEDKNKYREGRKLLLTTVEPLKEKGGQTYGTLAYFLGVCYVKLDIAGDNIRTATHWMSEASKTESPYQAEAKKTLAAIQGAQ